MVGLTVGSIWPDYYNDTRRRKTAVMCEGHSYIDQHSCSGKSTNENGGHV